MDIVLHAISASTRSPSVPSVGRRFQLSVMLSVSQDLAQPLNMTILVMAGAHPFLTQIQVSSVVLNAVVVQTLVCSARGVRLRFKVHVSWFAACVLANSNARFVHRTLLAAGSSLVRTHRHRPVLQWDMGNLEKDALRAHG